MTQKKHEAGKEAGRQKERANRGLLGQRGPKYWVAVTAVGALVAYSPVSKGVTVLYAGSQDARAEATSPSRQEAPAQPERQFAIPAGPLADVVGEFERATGWRVMLSRQEIGQVQSPGVSGVHTAEDALERLLANTGITFRRTGAETVVLELRGRPEQVTVTDDVLAVTQTMSSPKYTEPLRDVPQSITVIPRALIEQQGATTLRDALRNVPALTVTAGEGGTPAGDNLSLRGFSARNDIFVDGVRDLGPQARDPFNLEQVEVVEGPGSSFSGRGSTGGTINLVSKSPLPGTLYGGAVSFGTDGTKRVTGDVNVPVRPLGEHTSFRLNAMFHDSDVAGRDAVTYQRWGVAPSISFGLNTPTRLSFSYFRLEQDNLSDYGIPWVPASHNVLVEYRDRPAPVPRNTFYGFRSRDYERLGADLGTVKVEHDFRDGLTLRHQFRVGYTTRDSIATPPRFASPDSTVINREMRSWLTEDWIFDNQTDLRADFRTGGVGHALVAGLALTRENNLRVTRSAPNSQTTLLDPNPDDMYPGTITVNPNVGDVTGDSLAAYVFDTLRLGRRWELTGGLRWEYFGVEGVTTAAAPVSRVDRMLSARAGVVYKPAESGSLYFAYGTSLNPSLEGLSYNVANTAIEPEKTRSFEAGTKWSLFRDRLLLSGAVFQTTKTNARTPGVLPDDPPQVLEGRQRVNGLELSATGGITPNWNVFAAYSLLDSRIVESNNPAEVGNRFQNTPRNAFNLWTSYRSPWRLLVGGGVRVVGKRFGNNTNTRFVDRYALLEAMASYPLTEQVDLRVNLYNLTDEYYFDRLGGGHLVPGPARSVVVSTNFRF